MFWIFRDSVFLKLLFRSDGLSQLVFLLLLVVSVACWWIFIYKMYLLKSRITQAKKVREKLHSVNSVEELANVASTLYRTVAGNLIVGSLSAIKRMVKIAKTNDRARCGDSGLLRLTLDHYLKEILKENMGNVSILRISAETGPLIGLFGTVWGIITSFNSISELRNADIPTVAPGISQALVITLMGLFVAIPALVQYAFVVQKAKQLEAELLAVCDRIEWIVSMNLPRTNEGWEDFYEKFEEKTKSV